MRVFFSDGDYQLRLDLMSASCRERGVEVRAHCLMPNHVHLVAVPETEDGLRRAIGDAHRRYSRRINLREGWRGHLFQGGFASFAMDEAHLLAAARYIELNPVKAGLVEEPQQWKWSSAAARRRGRGDGFVAAQPLLALAGDWKEFLGGRARRRRNRGYPPPRAHRPPPRLAAFLDRIESLLARSLRPRKRGPKGKRGRRERS